MIIWLVNFDETCGDCSCAWSTREGAQNYLANEFKRLCFINPKWGEMEFHDHGGWEEYIHDATDTRVAIEPLCLDEKPYTEI